MTEHIRKIRPARAAIAAVLAFSATPLIAQTVAPPPVAPTVTAPAPEAAPAPATAPAVAAPPFAASQPVVQPVPAVEAPAVAATVSEAAAPAVKAQASAASPAAAPRRAQAVAPSPKIAAVESAQPAKSVTPPSDVTAARDVAPVAPAAPVAAAPVAEPTVTQNEVRTDHGLLWAAGGTALLLAGLGGAAMMRRRRATDRVADDRQFDAPMAVEPVVIQRSPAPQTVPAFAAAPSAMQHEGDLAAMVAAAPSAENPFLTHAKRTRRAKFLLEQRANGEAVAPTMSPVAPAGAPALIGEQVAADRSQTVYRFGGQTARPSLLKPRTS